MKRAGRDRVGFLLLHSQAKLYLAMGAYLERQGVEAFYYVRTDAERRAFAASHDVPAEKVVVADLVMDVAAGPTPDRDALLAQARSIEERSGETIARIGLSHRHLGRGFSPGSHRYPRDPRIASIGHDGFVAGITAQVAFWEREIAEKGLTVVIDAGKEAAVACRMAGIAFRWLIYARYKDHRAWSTDEYQSLPDVPAIFSTIPDLAVNPTEAKLYVAAEVKRGKFWNNQRLGSLLLRLIRNCTIILGKDCLRGRFEQIGYDHLIGYPIRVYRESLSIRRLSTATAHSLEGQPYVYLPLQKEPEQALLMAAPEHTDQLAIAIDLARSLPAGVKLAISEHFMAIGRRPAAFYQQLGALPNVVFLSFDEHPLSRIANAAATVTISGTAAFEAATMGKPAIVYNPRSVPAFLPHVFVVGRDGTPSEIFKRIFSGEIDEARARRDGAKFEEALARASFSLGDYGTLTTERDGVEPPVELVERAAKALMDSLPARQERASA
jgi:hypothetical protein